MYNVTTTCDACGTRYTFTNYEGQVSCLLSWPGAGRWRARGLRTAKLGEL